MPQFNTSTKPPRKKVLAMLIAQSRGYTLVEIMLVIAGAAAIATAAVLLGGKARNSANIADSVAISERIIKGVASRHAATINYSGLGMEPPGFVDGVSLDGNSIVGRWGPISLAPATVSGPNDSWLVTFADVPKTACASFVARASESFAATTVNGIDASARDGAAVQPTEAVALCSGASNAVVFRGLTLRTATASVVPLLGPSGSLHASPLGGASRRRPAACHSRPNSRSNPDAHAHAYPDANTHANAHAGSSSRAHTNTHANAGSHARPYSCSHACSHACPNSGPYACSNPNSAADPRTGPDTNASTHA